MTRLVPTLSASATPPRAIDLFPQKKVRRMLGITSQQLNQWERLRLIEPQWHDQEKVYTFADLIALNTVKQLTRDGLTAPRLQRALEAFRRQRPATYVTLADQIGRASCRER